MYMKMCLYTGTGSLYKDSIPPHRFLHRVQTPALLLDNCSLRKMSVEHEHFIVAWHFFPLHDHVLSDCAIGDGGIC